MPSRPRPRRSASFRRRRCTTNGSRSSPSRGSSRSDCTALLSSSSAGGTTALRLRNAGSSRLTSKSGVRTARAQEALATGTALLCGGAAQKVGGFARGFALVLVAAPSVSAANSLAAFFDKSTGGVDVRTRTEATRMNARQYVHRLRAGRSINAMSAVAARKSGRRVSHSPFEWVPQRAECFSGEGHA